MNNLSALTQNITEVLSHLLECEKSTVEAQENEQSWEILLKQKKNALIIEHYSDKDKLKEFGPNDVIRDARLAELLAPLAESTQEARRQRIISERNQRTAALLYQHQRDLLRIAELTATYK